MINLIYIYIHLQIQGVPTVTNMCAYKAPQNGYIYIGLTITNSKSNKKDT